MNEMELQLEAQTGTLLTADGYAALQQELETLTTVKRQEIAERIRDSQQHGEFSEDNNELDEVKLEQAMVETRIAELQELFGNAQILNEAAIPTDHVGIGSRVTLLDLTYDDEFEVRLVSSIEADPARDYISTESPMGLAIYGAEADQEVFFDAPEGRKRFKIVSITR
ncbi:MAG: transcription elongation factor GreA [Fimbriimonadaceae bacterium]|nr:transcription elongation factor GreA [Fimbriimonadaceae bacterium]